MKAKCIQKNNSKHCKTYSIIYARKYMGVTPDYLIYLLSEGVYTENIL
jgi:hypothetical protein